MTFIEERLQNLGLELPVLQQNPQALFEPYVINEGMLHVSGQLPLGFGELSSHVGQLGGEIDIEKGSKIAQICALNVLYQVNKAIPENQESIKCVKLTVFVNSTADFTAQPTIANAASELMKKVFGDNGLHARSAIGVAQLPFGVAVEIEAIFSFT